MPATIGLTDPVAQGRTVEIEPVAGMDRALPVQRQMIEVFGDQQMRQPCRARHARAALAGMVPALG
jgi:hypothetical protein